MAAEYRSASGRNPHAEAAERAHVELHAVTRDHRHVDTRAGEKDVAGLEPLPGRGQMPARLGDRRLGILARLVRQMHRGADAQADGSRRLGARRAEHEGAVEDVGGHDALEIARRAPDVDELDRGRIAGAHHDRELRLGAQLPVPAAVVRAPVLDPRGARQVAELRLLLAVDEPERDLPPHPLRAGLEDGAPGAELLLEAVHPPHLGVCRPHD
jgi:hypothetical protein